MSWRTVEALAIAMVFCMMMGVSIHRLLAFPGHTSSPSATLEPRDASPFARSTPTVLTSSHQRAATQKPRQWRSDSEDDAFDDVVVIHYQASARKDTTSEAGVRIATGQVREILAETVVQYGDDVTVWSRNPKRAGLDLLRH